MGTFAHWVSPVPPRILVEHMIEEPPGRTYSWLYDCPKAGKLINEATITALRYIFMDFWFYLYKGILQDAAW